MTDSPAPRLSGGTAWARRGRTPLREFLRTETGSAAILAGATVAALVWANVSDSAYEQVWATRLSARIGSAVLSMDLRTFVNSGLMTFFFLVVGLEARREFDMGELRLRSRLMLPFLAGLGGMVVPAGIYLAFNAGRPTAHGWGATIATDTAFALGALALVGRGIPDRVRTYLLTFSIVDDLVSLLVIGVFYSAAIRWAALGCGIALLAAVAVVRARGVRNGLAYFALGLASWVAFFSSGVDPVVTGLVMGLLSYAYPASRTDLEQASAAFRLFREQPTAELAQSARDEVRIAISPNERLQQLYHPWTSFLIVPLFALANAGVVVTGSFLVHAYTSPIALGIIVGYLAGKPMGTTGMALLAARVTRGRVTPPVGWGSVAGAGTIAGIGFTVSLLIASLAFTGADLAYAKVGTLSAVLLASLLGGLLFRVLRMLPLRRRLRAVYGTSESLTDLAVPVDAERDHIRGPRDKAPVTVVEYGDFECPYCGQAEPVVRALLRDFGQVRYVWRHLPLTDVHPHAQLAAEAAEAAAKQGKFWEMHDLLFDHQDALTVRDLFGYARELGLDLERFTADLKQHVGAARVAEDVDSADLATVSGTPTFFINGSRHYGAYDIATLSAAVKTAMARAKIGHPLRAGGDRA
jgi:Na+/H+ antiporter NhaA